MFVSYKQKKQISVEQYIRCTMLNYNYAKLRYVALVHALLHCNTDMCTGASKLLKHYSVRCQSIIIAFVEFNLSFKSFFSYSQVNSSQNHLLKISYVPGTALGLRYKAMNKVFMISTIQELQTRHIKQLILIKNNESYNRSIGQSMVI